VVEARSLLRRRDADPHYRRHTTRVAVGVRLGAGGRGCGGARPDHAASGGGSRARHVAQRGQPTAATATPIAMCQNGERESSG